MLDEFNLLATTSRGNENEACSELMYLLGQIGDSAQAVDKTGVSGLIAVKTAINPFKVIEELRETVRDRPYEFRYVFRMIPIEKVIATDLRAIERTAADLSSKIGLGETFRVTVEKRLTEFSTRELVEAAATKIERKVDLVEPNKILLVEVVGGLTGLSVIESDNILSVLKEKMR